MNKWMICAALLLVSQSPAMADERMASEAEERIEHYAAQQPADNKEAQHLLSQKIALIKSDLADSPIVDSAFEDIHQASYTLEACVDKLRADAGIEESLIDHLDESVQALHFASENHEEGKLREWFAKMQVAEKQVIAAMTEK